LDIPAELGHYSAKKTVELSKTLQNLLDKEDSSDLNPIDYYSVIYFGVQSLYN